MPTRLEPASVRYNNPGAQWPGPVSRQFGSTGSERIGGGNLIAKFPTPIHGAAAHISLLNRSYTGMTLADAVRKWTGGTSDPSAYIQSVSKATGLKPDTVLTRGMFSNPKIALPFVQAMAGEEAGRSGTLSSEQWRQGYSMAFPDTGPTVELPRGSNAATGKFLEINPADTSQDPGGISQGGEFSLGDTSIGGDLNTDLGALSFGEGYPDVSASSQGEPQLPTGSSNLNAEPSLFPDSSNPNAFNEWWKATNDTPSATVNAGDGGSIWEGETTLSDFGGDTTLGSNLNSSLSDLGFGEGYSDAPEAAFNPVPEPTGIPVEPNTLPQEYEWTTSPGDERFLPGSQPEAATRTVSGLDLRTFGDPSANNSLTLGQYLSTPLANMNFGGGYPVQGGVADTSRSNIATGALQIDPLTGRPFDLSSISEFRGGTDVTAPGNDWRENAANPPGNENAYGEKGEFNAWPRAELMPQTAITPGHIQSGQYYDWTTGSVRNQHATATARDNAFNYGYGQSVTSREGAALMSQQAFGGNPNRMLVSDEELIAQSEFGGARYVGPGNRDRTSILRSMYPRGVFTDAGRTGGTAVGGGG